jgi:hypothetical protein
MSEAFLETRSLEEKMTQDEYKLGCDRLFPMGPECEFEGKKVPCFVSCTENGSITSKLLVVMLKAIEFSGVLPRGVGLPDPFLLLDGQSSRFDVPFLEYINNEEHKWWTCIGTPY